MLACGVAAFNQRPLACNAKRQSHASQLPSYKAADCSPRPCYWHGTIEVLASIESSHHPDPSRGAAADQLHAVTGRRQRLVRGGESQCDVVHGDADGRRDRGRLWRQRGVRRRRRARADDCARQRPRGDVRGADGADSQRAARQFGTRGTGERRHSPRRRSCGQEDLRRSDQQHQPRAHGGMAAEERCRRQDHSIHRNTVPANARRPAEEPSRRSLGGRALPVHERKSDNVRVLAYPYQENLLGMDLTAFIAKETWLKARCRCSTRLQTRL